MVGLHIRKVQAIGLIHRANDVIIVIAHEHGEEQVRLELDDCCTHSDITHDTLVQDDSPTSVTDRATHRARNDQRDQT